MTNVTVFPMGVGPEWAKACRAAMNQLNVVFAKRGVGVVLTEGSSDTSMIKVIIDPQLSGFGTNGDTYAELQKGATKATVKLPKTVWYAHPKGNRQASAKQLELIVAHEFGHALGADHSSLLMFWPAEPSGDSMTFGGVAMPPIRISDKTVSELSRFWP